MNTVQRNWAWVSLQLNKLWNANYEWLRKLVDDNQTIIGWNEIIFSENAKFQLNVLCLFCSDRNSSTECNANKRIIRKYAFANAINTTDIDKKKILFCFLRKKKERKKNWSKSEHSVEQNMYVLKYLSWLESNNKYIFISIKDMI